MKEEIKKAIIEGLKEIQQGVGAFNRDPLEHASNVIENNKEIARPLLCLIEQNP